MDVIQRQVAQARRRLVFQQFLRVAPLCLSVALVLAAIGMAVPKIWIIAVNRDVWMASWLGGAMAAGILAAMIWTWIIRRGSLDAAVEIDRRFGLKERVSSALSLPPAERETEIGQALIRDASQRIELLAVSEKFQFEPGIRWLSPILPVAAACGIALLLPDARQAELKAATTVAAQRQQITKSVQALRERLHKKQEEAQKKGLEDAEELFRKITQGIDDLEKKDDVDQRKALVKLNNLAKELAERRQALGDSDQMKQQLEKLTNLEKGPADKLAQAMKEGNFEKAIQQLKELKEQLEKGELSDEDKAKLTRQIEQMKQKIEELAEAHRDAKRDLQRQIEQKLAQGDMEAVNRLQKKLDQLEQADKQMSRMEKMAQKMNDFQEAMQNGDTQKASDMLAQLEDDLESMQADMEQLESIEELMDELSDAKMAMRGENGEPLDAFSMSGEMGDQFGMGDGLGEGQGTGYRPEQETATGSYDSRQRAKPKAGQAVRVGDAGGPNQAGRSTEEVKEQILSSLSKDPDALTEQRLPRSQQDHVKEYYQRLRKGE
ncbi:MAG: hypothetical protein AB7F89_18110 [Pirellulaceae bacterium]